MVGSEALSDELNGSGQDLKLMVSPHQAGATPASRSVPMPRPRCCCGKGTPISTGMAMEKPVKCSEAESTQ